MERVVPLFADTGGPYKQLLAAEQTAHLIQTWIQGKEDDICTIRRQVREVGQDVPYSVVDGHIKQLGEDIGGFKRLLEFNEASRNHWRGLHMAAWRATVRPLKVLDMPNEILMKIFANFEDDAVSQIQVDDSSFDDSLPRPDLASIRNIRLTCRLFCEIASEILLPVVDISFTRSSLQRLQEISNHPTISRSVRVLRLHANPYNPSVANNRPEFVGEIIHELCNICKAFVLEKFWIGEELAEVAGVGGMTSQLQMFKSMTLQHEAALTQADLVITTLKKVLDNPGLETWSGTYKGQISKAIDEAHQEYGRRSLEQQSHMDDPHALANIIAAVGHMTNVQKICIPDEGSHHWDHIFRTRREKRCDAQKFEACMKAANPFWDLMVYGGYRDGSFPLDQEPLLPLLHKLPFVLQVPNGNLTHLDINLPSLGSHLLQSLAEHLLKFRHSFQTLKLVQITILESTVDTISRDSEGTLPMTYSLIETILASPRLEVVKLHYRMRGDDGPEVLVEGKSIGRMLANLPWKNLRSLYLNGFSIYIEELRRVLQKVSGMIHIELSRIRLLQGTWLEALEILRGSADSSSRVIKPRGDEMINMSVDEKQHFLSQFHGEGHCGRDYDEQCPGPASLYIRGGNIPSPLIRGDD